MLEADIKKCIFIFKQKFEHKKLIFTDFNSSKGWFYDTKKMLKFLKTKLIFIGMRIIF